ncbi:MAG: hypothetical protein ILP08_00270 [Lachnospiraceae bacterium]|nr:hypothetical protein [Lachnospiraceae bacterium]
MTELKMWEIILNIMQIPLSVTVIVVMIRKTKRPRSLLVTFFIFAMLAYALDDVYWIAYDFLRPDKWMPFAANEIAGGATVLLLGAALSTKIDKRFPAKISEIIFNLVFFAGCIWLWIAWSGEWFQDIIFTLPYIYFTYILLRGMRNTKALSRTATYFAVAICAVIVILDGIGLYVSEGTAGIIYNINYGILNGTSVYLFIKIIRDRRKGTAPEKTLFQSFAFFFWTMLVLDMSSELFYNIGLFIHMVAIFMMFIAVLAVADEEIRAGEPVRSEAYHDIS